MELWVIRHASTLWNETARYQGHTDLVLSEKGRADAATWSFARGVVFDAVYASSLARARETAAIVAVGSQIQETPDLREMSLGTWEGRTHAEVQAELGREELELEWKGLDHRAPGGESLRDVMRRLERWLASVPRGPGRALVVSHKGTMQALYALATGWDALYKPKPRPRFPFLHRYEWDGRLRLLALNEPLEVPRE